MEEEQTNLAANAGLFIDLLLQTPAQFNIAIITTDMQDPEQSGRFQTNWVNSCPPNRQRGTNPKILTRQTPNLKDVFAQNFRQGTCGDGFEKGLQAIETALSEPLLSNENAGFLRRDAALAVIVVGDEEDCSHPPGVIPEFDGDECVRNIDRMYPVSRYIDFLKGLKGGDASKISFAAITGPDIPQALNRPACSRDNECTSGRCSDGKCCPVNPTFTACRTDAECQSGETCLGRKCVPRQTRRPYPPRDCSCFAAGTGLSEPGTRFLEMVKAFGANGVFASICAADWSQSLADIAGGVVELVCKYPLTSFKLNPNARPAAERDIVVKVEGVEIPATGWTYNCPETGTNFEKGSVSFASASCPPLGATVQFFYEPTETPPQTCGTRNPAGTCGGSESCGNCGYCERRP
jgi:hypothetical protein